MTSNFDLLRLSVEANSGGKNTVILDDLGMPSIMVRIPKFKLSDVGLGTGKEWHPMFIIDGNVVDEVFIGKYQAVVENNRAYSLPGRDPALISKDRAHEVCVNKGSGWHLTSNAEYAGIALWCKANGFYPRGNNYCGCDVNAKHEKGVESYDWTLYSEWRDRSNRFDGTYYHHTGRVLTGSGPTGWSHDGTADGIYDLNGNVWEWVSGLRLNEGEIQIIPNNNSAMGGDETATSSLWRAILADGTLVAPGTAGTLKLDYAADKITLATTITTSSDTEKNTAFESIASASGLNIPPILKTLGVYPDGTGYGGDFLYMRNAGERLPLRGGGWYTTNAAGVFALGLSDLRSAVSHITGFRSSFVKL